jgi:hypothetical protein
MFGRPPPFPPSSLNMTVSRIVTVPGQAQFSSSISAWRHSPPVMTSARFNSPCDLNRTAPDVALLSFPRGRSINTNAYLQWAPGARSGTEPRRTMSVAVPHLGTDWYTTGPQKLVFLQGKPGTRGSITILSYGSYRLTKGLAASLEGASKRSGTSRGRIIRERLEKVRASGAQPAVMRLGGCVRGARDLSARHRVFTPVRASSTRESGSRAPMPTKYPTAGRRRLRPASPSRSSPASQCSRKRRFASKRVGGVRDAE